MFLLWPCVNYFLIIRNHQTCSLYKTLRFFYFHSRKNTLVTENSPQLWCIYPFFFSPNKSDPHNSLQQSNCQKRKISTHTYSLIFMFFFMQNYFLSSKYWVSCCYISSYLWDTFELFWHLRLWFIPRKTCCILGGYALMRRIKSSRTVIMSCLRLRNNVC